MTPTENFAKDMKAMADHLQVKARLTRAEQLLLQSKTVIENQRLKLHELREDIKAIEKVSESRLEDLRKIPSWIRRIFDAD